MNRYLLFIILFAGISLTGLAQTKPLSQLSIGAEYGIPVGKAASVYGSVVGGSFKLEIPAFKSPVFFTITTGITDYLVKLDYVGNANPATYVPLEIGGKYYFSKIGYIEADAGISANLNGDYTGNKDAFIFAPVIGFSARTSKHKAKVDVGLRYEGRAESNGVVGQIALRVAYRFGLK